MEGNITLELRGNGVILRVFQMLYQQFEYLEKIAKNHDEPLASAWFDPVFRQQKSVETALQNIQLKAEYRGLFADKRSFLEIRQPRKQRVKYLMEQLLGDGMFFPPVEIAPFLPKTESGQIQLLELTYGTGCMAKFHLSSLDLGQLRILLLQTNSHLTDRLVLFNRYDGRKLSCSDDDFLVRRTTITL